MATDSCSQVKLIMDEPEVDTDVKSEPYRTIKDGLLAIYLF